MKNFNFYRTAYKTWRKSLLSVVPVSSHILFQPTPEFIPKFISKICNFRFQQMSSIENCIVIVIKQVCKMISEKITVWIFQFANEHVIISQIDFVKGLFPVGWSMKASCKHSCQVNFSHHPTVARTSADVPSSH